MGVQSFGNPSASFRGRFGRTGKRAANPYIEPSPISATGGNQTPSSGLAPGNGYKYHTFTSPGNFVVSSGNNTIEFLVVGGGGSGGFARGGGGAGGLAYSPSYPITPGTYPITVGSGGPNTPYNAPGAGTDTTFTIGASTIYGRGGGGAFPYASPPNFAGGSGGGGNTYGPGTGGTASQPSEPTFGGLVLNYGNNGGDASSPEGAGGGGAGAAGTPGGGSPGGNGRQYPNFTGPLIGVPALAPLSGYFAGGGGGATRDGGPAGTGGLGGGGNGKGSHPNPGDPGVANSGGGGGGGGTTGGVGNSPGGSGGPGIVVIRYLA